MNIIDRFLNSITMYKLVLYGLACLLALAFVLSFFDAVGLGFTPLHFIISFFIVLWAAHFSNILFGKMVGAHRNVESVYITAFILLLVLKPGSTIAEWVVLAGAAVIAMASKYVLAINKKHIFNPAAIALLTISMFGSGLGIWWIGSKVLMIPTLLLGLLVVRKIRRFKLFFTFVITAAVSITITGLTNGFQLSEILSAALYSYPWIFFGTIMLTEPLTTPPSVRLQIIYGIIVGALFGSQFHLGPFYATPEFALIIGNIFSFFVSPQYKLRLKLQDTKQLGADIYEFSFATTEKMDFKPGQYLEWTLEHPHPDSRGNRRYFTIASSPTESDIKLGIRQAFGYQSSFKRSLVNLEKGSEVIATSLSGDFLLPQDRTQKLVFIAGGIGITPFRSMIKYLIDTDEKRDIILFYFSASPENFAYQNIFEEAKKIGLTTHYVVDAPEIPKDWKGLSGKITPELLKSHVADFNERMFYISGPNGMVTGYKKLLQSQGIERSAIKTDYFPGF